MSDAYGTLIWKHFSSVEVVVGLVELYRISGETRSLAFCLETNGAFPLHGTPRYGSVRFTFGGFPLSTVPGTWYFFSTTSAEVPSDPYRYQNVIPSVPTRWAPVQSALPRWDPVPSAPPWHSDGFATVPGLGSSTWTWPSVSSPDSTSAPPPSWIVLCVERLEAALWGGGFHELTPTHHISCTTLQLHPRTAFPIHHCTNHTAVTNHSFALITQLHTVWHAL